MGNLKYNNRYNLTPEQFQQLQSLYKLLDEKRNHIPKDKIVQLSVFTGAVLTIQSIILGQSEKQIIATLK